MNKIDLLLRIVLIVMACALTVIIFFITKKYKTLVRARKKKISKEEVVGRIFMRKLKKIDETSDQEPPKELFSQLNNIIRNFFSELYDISYEFAFVELNEELVKKDVEESKRKDIIDYTMEMEKSEYSDHTMTKQEFYYLLGKSIHIIKELTGYKEDDYALQRVPEKFVPPKPAKEPEPVKPEKAEPPSTPPSVPKKNETVEKIRSLIIKADNNLNEKKPEAAMENYTQLRELYNTLSPEVKRSVHTETHEIIRIYNSLLREYKGMISG